MNDCIINDILKDFLIKHREDILDMDWLYEYDEEKHMQMEREEWIEVGRQKEQFDIIRNALSKNHSAQSVSEFNGIPLNVVLEVEREMNQKKAIQV